jgi:cobalt/nickel transport system ATP-binding protein
VTAAIEIENFSYTYADGIVALDAISLSLRHGERVALIGPNGAGKSTLLLAICGFLRGTGKIRIDGLELTRANMTKIRRVLGAVMQDPNDQLFMPTLFDDVAFGPLNLGLSPDEVRRRAEETLARVGLAGQGSRPGHHFSAGQKRGAAIATVLSMNPKIITMDEPDSSLDPRSRDNFIELLSKLDQTLVIATCNMDFAARVCGRAVLIDHGKLIADGHSHIILSDADLMKSHGLETARSIKLIA